MQRILKRIGAGLLTPAVAALLLAGCEVKNPGAILDVDLNSEATMAALVTGMSADFSLAVDEFVFDMGRGSDNITGSGSYFETGLLRNGIVNREDQNFEWGSLHQARYVAEDGIERMRVVFGPQPEGTGTYDGHDFVARAFLFAALAHRMSGECLCYAVIDSSAAMPRGVHFDSALVRADSAIWHASRAGLDSLVMAARGVMAQAYAAKGDWANATAQAALVDTDFMFVAFADDNSGREENQTRTETWNRAEMSVWGTVAGSFYDSTGTWGRGDPRAPFIDCTVTPQPAECNSQQGADGETDHWQQNKYPDLGTDYPVIKGTEMRLIEAEAFLRNTDIPNATIAINEARAEYGLDALSAPAAINDAWIWLDQERQLTLWMEARRWWDAYRWDQEGRTFMPAVLYINGTDDLPLYPSGTVTYKYPKNPDIPQRRTCIPISLAECQTNPNVLNTAECAGDFVGP
jgi:hypothetical protein